MAADMMAANPLAANPTAAAKRPRQGALEREARRTRIFGDVLAGESLAAIGRKEKLSGERVRQILRHGLEEDANGAKGEHQRLQLLRLRPPLRLLYDRVLAGEVKAVPIYLKVLERLDKAHAQVIAYGPAQGQSWRRRLSAKLDEFAARHEANLRRVKSDEERAADARIRAANEAERAKWQPQKMPLRDESDIEMIAENASTAS